MKLSTFLYSLYLLALAVTPCSDKDDCKYLDIYKSISQTTDHSDHTGDSETCSPFCLCGCCGQTYSFQQIQTDLCLNVPIVERKTTVYQPSFVSEVCFTIWQPPKI